MFIYNINTNMLNDKRFVMDYIISTLLEYSQNNINNFIKLNYAN